MTDGAPKYVPIPGTSLQYVANSDAAVFRDVADGRIYYLVSGRWFAAAGLGGPWSFATPRCRPISRASRRTGRADSSACRCPGPPRAAGADRGADSAAGHTRRSTAKLAVVYAGTPKFEPIAGTEMHYAVNTSFDVIRVGAMYYAAGGGWFEASAAEGAWTLAASVPAVIYTIPPASPVYRVTFVRVYAVAPNYVTYGYTAGYTMATPAPGSSATGPAGTTRP